MPEWIEEVDERKVQRALENCYMMARRKRATVYSYPNGALDPVPIGPKSDDTDWDRIIRFCEDVGLRSTILRTAKNEVV